MEGEEVIFDKLPDGCDHFGFMNASSELYLGKKGKVSYCFLHLTLQEFLAAFHISQLPADEQKQLFDEYGHDKEYQRRQMLFRCHKQGNFDVVWRFVAGLTGFKGIEDAWKVFMFKNMTVNADPFYIRCLYEAQEKVDCNSVFPESKVISYVCNYDIQLLDYYALGYCVSASRCKWELRMDTSEFDGGEFVMLSYQLQDRGGENIVSLYIGHDDDLFARNPTFLESLAQLISNLVKLKKFIIEIEASAHASGALVKVFNALSELAYLHTLVVYLFLTPGSDDNYYMTALSHLIKQSKFLKNLDLHLWESLSFECLQLLAEAVFSSSSLNEVKIDTIWDKWDWSSGINPFTALEANHHIKRLTLFDFSLKSISNLAKALHKNTALISLCIGVCDNIGEYIEYSDLTTTSVTALSEMIKVNHTLEQLVIQNLKVTRDDILTLNKALQHNTTLKQLKLRWIEVIDCSDLTAFNELDPRISDNIREECELWPIRRAGEGQRGILINNYD